MLGEKDYQQLLIIRRMVADLFMPIEVIGCPTVREIDGLAMSSRNQYLTASQRHLAGHLFQILTQIRARIEAGEDDFTALEQHGQQQLSAQGFKPDYVAVRCSNTLAIPSAETIELIILAAAYLGTARLIDNIACRKALIPTG
ncbi:MAG: pantoate--beta-alanine ligase [Pseudomonadota bacterium]|nr:pantoate--beta-alanine ligase [Pseudomonadota bacterium]